MSEAIKASIKKNFPSYNFSFNSYPSIYLYLGKSFSSGKFNKQAKGIFTVMILGNKTLALCLLSQVLSIIIFPTIKKNYMKHKLVSSFTQLSNEISDNRFYGGLHYMATLVKSTEQGKKVAQNILNTVKFLKE